MELENRSQPLTGYDLPPIGLNNGHFTSIHVNALTCIAISFTCGIAVIIVQFKFNRNRFYKWPTGERMAVYQAISHAFINFTHTLDHVHMLITRNHVTPPVVCKIYGGFLSFASNVQRMTVILIAVHLLLVVYFNRKISFGKNDRKLYFFVFTIPLIWLFIGHATDIYGPSGAFILCCTLLIGGVETMDRPIYFIDCYTDAMQPIAFLLDLVVPVTIVCFGISVIYVMVWFKILNKTKGATATTNVKNAATEAAKRMSMFVLAFLTQWVMADVFGIWALIAPPPLVVFYLTTTFLNLGGLFNLIVYVIIRRWSNKNSVGGSSNESVKKTDQVTTIGGSVAS